MLGEMGWDGLDRYLADVGYVLALLELELVVRLLPVIGHRVDGVGAGDGFGQRSLVVDVALPDRRNDVSRGIGQDAARRVVVP